MRISDWSSDVCSSDLSLAVHWSSNAANKPADPRLPELGHRWLAPADAASADHAAAWRAHRLGLGVTEGIAELGSDQTLWLEANAEALNGVDFRKGRYVGPENTAQIGRAWRRDRVCQNVWISGE